LADGISKLLPVLYHAFCGLQEAFGENLKKRRKMPEYRLNGVFDDGVSVRCPCGNVKEPQSSDCETFTEPGAAAPVLHRALIAGCVKKLWVFSALRKLAGK